LTFAKHLIDNPCVLNLKIGGRKSGPLRSDLWLAKELDRIWQGYFADVPRVNEVIIRFMGNWKTRLGVIKLSECQRHTLIGVNGLLRLPAVPPVIVEVTIAHELVHYAHGFGSPLPRKYRYPHRGGIVERELRRRGLGDKLADYSRWLEDHWFAFYESICLDGQRLGLAV
jgi:hypothetical protein